MYGYLALVVITIRILEFHLWRYVAWMKGVYFSNLVSMEYLGK